MVEAHVVHSCREAENRVQRLGVALPEAGLIIHVDHTRCRSGGEGLGQEQSRVTLCEVHSTERSKNSPWLPLKDVAVQMYTHLLN